MKTKRIIKLFSFCMVILILISSLPLSIFAEETNTEDGAYDESYTQDETTSDQDTNSENGINDDAQSENASNQESKHEGAYVPFWPFILMVIFSLPSILINELFGVYISFTGIFEEIFTFLVNIWNSIFG